jgi:hypothetical protein
VPGQQDRFLEELVQLGEVRGPAVRQVEVRLGADTAGHRRQLHERRVRLLLTAEHHHGQPAGQQPVEPFLPHPPPAEDAHDDQVDALDERGQVVDGQSRGVAEPVLSATRPGRQQVGVGGRQQQDHAGSIPRGVLAPGCG